MAVTVAAAGETRDWACRLLFLFLFGYGFHGAGRARRPAGDVVGRLRMRRLWAVVVCLWAGLKWNGALVERWPSSSG
jgi:hypothetical protein